MGKIKAGIKTSKIQHSSKEQLQHLKQEVVIAATHVTQPCPVIIDYRVRKFAKVLRKKQKEEITARMVADVKLGVRLQQDLEVLKQQLLNEIDGSYQANALPLEQLKQKIEELEAKLSQEPMIIQQISEPKEVKVIEKQVTVTKELVLPNYIKYSLLGLALVNILIILFK